MFKSKLSSLLAGLGISAIIIATFGTPLSDKAVLLSPDASLLVRGGQPKPGDPYPPGPGGPCANGISYFCESPTDLCEQQACTFDPFFLPDGDAVCYFPADPARSEKKQLNIGWTVCNFNYPTGMTQCVPFTWVCNQYSVCFRHPCEIKMGTLVCKRNPATTADVDTHAGQKLQGALCP